MRDLYDLRHTYATFALRAGVPVFALSRFMGTSIAMIDLHHGDLAVDSYQHAVCVSTVRTEMKCFLPISRFVCREDGHVAPISPFASAKSTSSADVSSRSLRMMFAQCRVQAGGARRAPGRTADRAPAWRR
jgi:hypothetical protein